VATFGGFNFIVCQESVLEGDFGAIAQFLEIAWEAKNLFSHHDVLVENILI
jgi:hypothetical protein